MNRESILKVEKLYFSYTNPKSIPQKATSSQTLLRYTLSDISFSVPPGDIFSILGPNGSGKTTLIKCLIGILKPQTGQITLKGELITKLPKRYIAQSIAFVPQIHRPVFPYTVLEVVTMGRSPYIPTLSTPKSEDIEIADSKIEQLGISHLKNRVYTTLSGGEIQLVLIARALTQEPDILVLDEPTAHLDFRNRILILEKINELSSTMGITIIMTMHDPNYTYLYSNNAIFLKGGKIKYSGPPKEIITEQTIQDIYGIETSEIISHNHRWLIPANPTRR